MKHIQEVDMPMQYFTHFNILYLLISKVTIYSGELKSTDRLYVLEQVQEGVFKMGLESQYGELAGWIKDMADRRFGPDWQCVVGKKESFGSCFCPRAGQYLNFSVGETAIILFKSCQ